MTSFVAVETLDFVDVARSLSAGVADPVADAGERLAGTLAGCGAMAGTDPGGESFAQTYDQAAGPAARAVLDVANGCYRLADLCGQTARNYDAAEAASSAGSQTLRDAAILFLPAARHLDSSGGPPSSAGGGSVGLPTGWSLIESRVGYVWPNGHQDRLRNAGAAWLSAGATLADRATSASLAPLALVRDGLPEYDDVHTACTAMDGRMRALAQVCGAIGHACNDLARHIDEVHLQVRSELVELGVESIGLQVIGAAFSTFTFGTAEAPTQAAQLAKIIAVAAAVADRIAAFIALARAAATQIMVVIAEAGRLAGELQALRDLRVVAVSVHGIGTFPALVRVPEGASIMRMEAAAASAPDLIAAVARGQAFVLRLARNDSDLAKIAPESRWRDTKTLTRHVEAHGAQLGVTSDSAYVRRASDFLQQALRDHFPTVLDRKGTMRIWDPRTKIFAVYDKDGLCKTIYIEKRAHYIDGQEGTRLW